MKFHSDMTFLELSFPRPTYISVSTPIVSDLISVKYIIPQFSANIYAGERRSPSFVSISNLFYPSTVDECLAHDGIGHVPGIKTDEGEWELEGHKKRIVRIDGGTLRVFARMMEGGNAKQFLTTRMPSPHSVEIVTALEKIGGIKERLVNSRCAHFATAMWNQTIDVRDTGIIRRDTRFANDPADMVISGPNIYLHNPLAKTPNTNCSTNRDYSCIDLETVLDNYLPRANYTPNVPRKMYRNRVQPVPWNKSRKHTDFYRFAFRRMSFVAHILSGFWVLFFPDYSVSERVWKSAYCEISGGPPFPFGWRCVRSS